MIIKDKFDKLVKVREKLESIFETAGGNPKNLKKAILRGKGNKNKEVAVSGLGFADSDASVLFMNSNTPLSQLLGPEIYYDENVNGMEGFEGFGELGEPATGAAIASATAAVAAIAKIVKSIGNIFGGGQKGSEDFSETETAAADKEVASSPSSTSSDSAVSPSSVTTSSSSEDASTSDSSASDTSTSSARVASDDSSESDSSEVALSPASSTSLAVTSTSDTTGGSADNQGFWQKNKKWLLPAVIGVGGIAAIAIGLKMLKKDTHSGVHGLEGTSSGRKPTPTKKQSKKKASVALM
jgi:hypothetical protein